MIRLKTYGEFLEQKKLRVREGKGIQIAEGTATSLFDFQRDIVAWALRKGRSCIFASTGLGKTAMQLTWANNVCLETDGNVLVLAPLAVARQTVREAQKFGLQVNLARSQKEVKPGINITNYEMLEHFDTSEFAGVVLDESSILKSHTSKSRQFIIDSFRDTPFKLACTATPAPNDHMELANHAEFIGVMTRTEMLAMFFVHDGGSTSKWRLKGHGVQRFWEWVASWAVMLSKPSDLGYPGHSGYDLPALNINQVTVDSDFEVKDSMTMTERREARQASISQRVKACAEVANASDEQWIIWCDLNDESKLLTSSIRGAVEVKGSDTPEHKAKSMLAFESGQVRVLVSKPSICGFGMNWQHCRNMAFVGLSDSFEAYFQAVRRCWRFGQTKDVNAYVITSKAEGAVVENIRRKEADFQAMLSGMIAATQEITKENIGVTNRQSMTYDANQIMQLPAFIKRA